MSDREWAAGQMALVTAMLRKADPIHPNGDRYLVTAKRIVAILGLAGLEIRDRAASASDEGSLDAERLGFRDLLAIGAALIEKYPPDTIVCSHSVKADIGARTSAAIADLIESCAARLRSTPPASEPETGK